MTDLNTKSPDGNTSGRQDVGGGNKRLASSPRGLTSIPPAPEPSTRIVRSVFAVSLAVHGSLIWVLHASAAEPVRVIPEQIEIELAPPPPPPPPPPKQEPEPEKPEVAPPPEPRPAHKPVPRLTPSATPAETAAKPEEIGTDIPQGEDGDLPPAPVGLAPPEPREVVAPPPPPPPPPPVIEAREGANYLNNPRPAYPRSALREGWQGRVVLRVRVLPNGKVESARVQTSAGHDTLDEAALEIVKSWSFVPATQGGKPIAGWVSVPFEFKIQ